MLLTSLGTCSSGDCESYEPASKKCCIDMNPAGYDFLHHRANPGADGSEFCKPDSNSANNNPPYWRTQGTPAGVYACPFPLSWNDADQVCDNGYLHAGDIGFASTYYPTSYQYWGNMVPYAFISFSDCENACGGCHGTFGSPPVQCAVFDGCRCICNDLGTSVCHPSYFPYEWTDGCCYTIPFQTGCPPGWTLGGGTCTPPCRTPTCPAGYTWNPTTELCEKTVADPTAPDTGQALKFNMHNHLYHARSAGAALQVACSKTGMPTFTSYATATSPTGTQSDVDPVFLTPDDMSLEVWLFYVRYTGGVSPNTRWTRSSDDGETWKGDVQLLPGCSHVAAMVLPWNHRRVVIAVEDSSHKLAYVVAEEDSLTFSAVTYCQESSGGSLINLLIATDSISLAPSEDMAGTLLMAAKRNGGAYAIFQSTDDGKTWKAVA